MTQTAPGDNSIVSTPKHDPFDRLPIVQQQHWEGKVADAVDRSIHAAAATLTGGFSPLAISAAWSDWAHHLAASPARQMQLATLAVQGARHLLQLSNSSLSSSWKCTPCAQSLPHDKRFRDPAWQRWPFGIYAETLLACENWWDNATKDISGATPHHLGMVNFMARQILDSVSPSNFPLTNPEILRATVATRGQNLVEGARYYADDFRRISTNQRPAYADAFIPGKTVAITPGQVVFRTRLAEIIQYTPTKKKVRPEPVVIVPARIMKYYFLDLSPENSMVKHLLDQGFSVFIISWRNPGPEDRDIGFDDYRTEGVMAALKAALAITASKKAHAVGYCIGGTLLAAAAAAMARDNDERLATISFLAAQTDFEEAGELKLFIDESQLALLDDMMAESGVFEASRMGGTFHMLRSNDLIWSRLVHHYFLGQDEPVTDLTAWSTDTTRLPARMQSEYLRGFYLHNNLVEGRHRIDGRSVMLRDIAAPIFAVAADHDYVAPWRSVYKIHMLTDSPITFLLTSGGHNRGIVAPPGQDGLHYRISSTPEHALRPAADEWLERNPLQDGSWWKPWFQWLHSHSGSFVSASAMGQPNAGFAAREPAPGTYVHG